ncbi:MAG: hypothetical protein KA066_00930, partial [Candidatus Pacebacteria bacterium]|nr:hypothetical protein [Candidatus Paceibacterota bacterium]
IKKFSGNIESIPQWKLIKKSFYLLKDDNSIDSEGLDFLGKYIGATVFAQGTVSQVSRSGANGFLVDLKVVGQTVTCPQESNDENEKQLPLLKGKKVQIVGKFPFSEIWGHGLGIDDCVLTRS